MRHLKQNNQTVTSCNNRFDLFFKVEVGKNNFNRSEEDF